MSSKKIIVLAALLVPVLVSSGVMAQTGGGFDLSWWSVDGGAGTSRGNGYTLRAGVGQPDAGVLTGANYTLTGGFWGTSNETTISPTPTPADGKMFLPLVVR